MKERDLVASCLTWDLFIVECDFDFVCDCFFWSVGDETLATAEDLDGIGNVTVVDGDLKLALSGAGCVNSENGNWMNLWHGFRNKMRIY